MSGLNPTPLAGQCALVTGAASGIGRATALLLAKAGAQLILVDVNQAGLSDVEKAIKADGGAATSQTVDLSDGAAVRACAQAALTAHAKLDILVNCAGITGKNEALLDITMDDWNRVFAINLTAPMLLMQAIGARMQENGYGRIVNITSSSAHRARVSKTAYGASKSGLMQMSRIAASELGPFGVTVNAVAPGLTQTAILDANFTQAQIDELVREGPLSNLVQRVSHPDDIANAVLFLCLPASRQITGQTLHVSGGAIIQA